ncbi:MAG: polyribonucleotide nucleotidyltransferase, partial [Chitinivibrionales bacterium]
MTVFNAETKINDAVVSLETGKVARQAAGAVTIRIGDTMILTTVCSGPAREGINFFPLTVEYIAKGYATGKIPGGFIKREGRPRDSEVLAARLVDRPIRPLFPEGYKDEVQIINTVISADEKYNADVLAITAASCALILSDLPFKEPVAGVRVGIVDGEFKAFPTMEESAENPLDIIVAGTENSIMMVEGGAEEVSEDKLIEAITFAHSVIKDIVAIQKELKEKAGKEKQEFTPPEEVNPELAEEVKSLAGDRLHELSFNGDKDARYKGLSNLTDEIIEKLSEKYPEQEGDIKKVIHDLEYEDMRATILKEGKRIGNRGLD